MQASSASSPPNDLSVSVSVANGQRELVSVQSLTIQACSSETVSDLYTRCCAGRLTSAVSSPAQAQLWLPGAAASLPVRLEGQPIVQMGFPSGSHIVFQVEDESTLIHDVKVIQPRPRPRPRLVKIITLVAKCILAIEVLAFAASFVPDRTRRRGGRGSSSGEGSSSGSSSDDAGNVLQTVIDYIRGKADISTLEGVESEDLDAALHQVAY
jgi:hypothetical protein